MQNAEQTDRAAVARIHGSVEAAQVCADDVREYASRLGERDHTGEERLLLAVLEAALLDATQTATSLTARRMRQDAWEWMCSEDSFCYRGRYCIGFGAICDHFGICRQAVRDRVKRLRYAGRKIPLSAVALGIRGGRAPRAKNTRVRLYK